ncbi:MAG: DUF2029 domain-containing protein [Planctomycetes bacterium]|nr:DUF2029 domain-containing protein [Planctomycetota bacterium]
MTTDQTKPALSNPDPRHWVFAPFHPNFMVAAWCIWVIFAVVVAVRTGLHPERNSVSACYRIASECWWNGRGMYENVYDDKFNDIYNGFVYLPHAAILFSPFYALPLWLGESLNRIVIIAMAAWAVWRITRLASGRAWNEYFFTASAITIGVGAGNAINGQYNLPLAATLMLATCTLIERRWWWASIWLVVSILLKPLALAPALLAFALFPALWWRLPVVLVAAFALPFVVTAHGTGYAWSEYQNFWTKVVRAAQPLPRRFAEFSTVLWWFGRDTSDAQRQVIRAIAALATLALSFAAVLRRGPREGALILWALGASYMVVFNPRTEGLTYVVVAPALALFGAIEYVRDPSTAPRRAVGIVLLAMGIVMIFVHELMPRSGAYYQVAQGSKDLLVRPMMAIVFTGWLVWLALVDRARLLPEATPAARSSP